MSSNSLFELKMYVVVVRRAEPGTSKTAYTIPKIQKRKADASSSNQQPAPNPGENPIAAICDSLGANVSMSLRSKICWFEWITREMGA